MTRRARGDIVRFAFEENKVAGKPSKLRSLFRPNKELKMSIGRAEGLNCREILDMALRFVGQQQNPSDIWGWLEFREEAAQKHGLEIIVDDSPRGHANVIWPTKREKWHLATLEMFQSCFRRAYFPTPVKKSRIPSDPCSYVNDYDPPQPPSSSLASNVTLLVPRDPNVPVRDT